MSCTLEDVQKLGLRVATIVAAEPVEGSEKLLKLQIDLGDEPRQIVAGIGKSFKSEELIGRQIVIVTEMESRTIFGIESAGMLLTATGETGLTLLTSSAAVPSGATIQ